MTTLVYRDAEGRYKERDFSRSTASLRIGASAEGNDIVLSAADVAAQHAVVVRSALNNRPLLVNLAGGHTHVNGLPVVSIKVLGHKDELQLGEALLTMWEVHIITLAKGDRGIGRSCLVCSRSMEEDYDIIECPLCPYIYHQGHRVPRAYHSICWLKQEHCPNGCGYPIRERVLDALAAEVKIEYKLDASSELFRNRKKCQECQQAFRKNNAVVYCPNSDCNATYHLACWLKLEDCKMPKCGYNIPKLVNRLFSINKEHSGIRGNDE